MTDVHNVAFLNPDNTTSLIAFNNGSNPDFKVRVGNKSFSYTLPQGAVATFKWQNDNTQTQVSITSPITGTSFDIPADITIEASATDGDNAITQIAFYEGATLLGTDTTEPYSFVWSNVAEGNYTLTAEATNDANVVTVSESVNVSVLNTSAQLIPNGVYKIFNTVNSEFISVETNAPHEAFMQAEDQNSDFQLWTITYEEGSDNIYRIVNNGSNTTLGINDNWCGVFGDVRANFSNTDSNVQFRIAKADEANTYNFQIGFTICNFGSINNPVKVFDVENGASGGQIQTFDIDATNPNQQFQIVLPSTLGLDEMNSALNDINLLYSETNRSLTLQSNQSFSISKIEVFDILGKLTITNGNTVSEDVKLDFNTHSNGLYVIKIVSNNKQFVKKVVVY
jgi:hypothetical protein